MRAHAQAKGFATVCGKAWRDYSASEGSFVSSGVFAVSGDVREACVGVRKRGEGARARALGMWNSGGEAPALMKGGCPQEVFFSLPRDSEIVILKGWTLLEEERSRLGGELLWEGVSRCFELTAQSWCPAFLTGSTQRCV